MTTSRSSLSAALLTVLSLGLVACSGQNSPTEPNDQPTATNRTGKYEVERTVESANSSCENYKEGLSWTNSILVRHDNQKIDFTTTGRLQPMLAGTFYEGSINSSNQDFTAGMTVDSSTVTVDGRFDGPQINATESVALKNGCEMELNWQGTVQNVPNRVTPGAGNWLLLPIMEKQYGACEDVTYDKGGVTLFAAEASFEQTSDGLRMTGGGIVNSNPMLGDVGPYTGSLTSQDGFDLSVGPTTVDSMTVESTASGTFTHGLVVGSETFEYETPDGMCTQELIWRGGWM